MILAIDPGTKILAYSVWSDGKLYDAGAVRSLYTKLSTRTADMYTQLIERFASYSFTEVVVEIPMCYPHGKNKVDPNDLISLAIVAGASLTSTKAASKWELVTPARWKGQRPKDVTQRRVKRELTDDELFTMNEGMVSLPAGLRHNVYDAIGIGLWRLGRT